MFLQEGIPGLLHYVYTDEIMSMKYSACKDCQRAALYYDIPLLTQLCENELLRHLRPSPGAGKSFITGPYIQTENSISLLR